MLEGSLNNKRAVRSFFFKCHLVRCSSRKQRWTDTDGAEVRWEKSYCFHMLQHYQQKTAEPIALCWCSREWQQPATARENLSRWSPFDFISSYSAWE